MDMDAAAASAVNVNANQPIEPVAVQVHYEGGKENRKREAEGSGRSLTRQQCSAVQCCAVLCCAAPLHRNAVAIW